MEQDKKLTLYFDERDREIKKLLIDTDSYDIEDEEPKKVIIKPKKVKIKDELNLYMAKYKLTTNHIIGKTIAKCKLKPKTMKEKRKEIYDHELTNNIKGGMFF